MEEAKKNRKENRSSNMRRMRRVRGKNSLGHIRKLLMTFVKSDFIETVKCMIMEV